MISRRFIVVLSTVVVAVLLTVPAAYGQTYTITVGTDLTSYTYAQTVKVSGVISPAPGPSTAVVVRVFNPSKVLVVTGEAQVGASTGAYNFTFVTGGGSGWNPGSYSVNATWGAFPPTITKAAIFAYTGLTTTTTTSSSSASSTSSTSTTSSSTSTTSSSTSTSSTSSSTSSSSTSSASSTSSSSTSSSTSSSGGGGIPEFPFQASLAGVVAALVVAAYLLVRRAGTQRPIIPSTR